jgi:acyl-[acyl-carrier-protein]-phospholipid O-acyltransferase / long-chain-fatty-acid--[acyl-carrier-protein] ligase
MTQTLFSELVRAARRFGGSYVIAEDITRKPATYRTVLTHVLALRDGLRASCKHDETPIGVLMPNTVGGAVTFFALQAMGKTPAMLNFGAGTQMVEVALAIAQVHTVITSRQFIIKAELEPLIEVLKQKTRIIYLEDIKPEISMKSKVKAALQAHFPWAIRPLKIDSNAPAVILFTSGSEGLPKGVALSHNNILSNIVQVTQRIGFTTSDRMFSSLPMFHSFGLTVGTILPLMLGVRVFFYPSPLHYKLIPPLIKETASTIMLGTDTFYKGYAHYAADDDFASVKLAIAGAEKLHEGTFKLYQERFGVTIYQGYGVTETSPVISCNTPQAHKLGTVGKMFAYQEGRVEPLEGIPRGGKLLIKGPNVMLGYLKIDQPGVIQPQGDWHDTGDIVEVDADGFIHILGRAKRFAKVGGEMISLTAVEELAAGAKPEHAHAAIAAPDERKGERIILFTECEALIRDTLIKQAAAVGYAEIGLPREIKYTVQIPRLGNGKVDYMALKQAYASPDAL